MTLGRLGDTQAENLDLRFFFNFVYFLMFLLSYGPKSDVFPLVFHKKINKTIDILMDVETSSLIKISNFNKGTSSR